MFLTWLDKIAFSDAKSEYVAAYSLRDNSQATLKQVERTVVRTND